MAPKLYGMLSSPPVRAVLMTAKAIGLELEVVHVNLLKGDHMTPDYLRINPQHTVPTLLDGDGYSLWDSHAIQTYIVDKCAKDDSLYPRDLKKRGLVHQRLHFDTGSVFPIALQSMRPLLFEGKKNIDQVNIDAANSAYAFLETFLGDNDWLTGDAVTIADISIFATTSSMNIVIPIDEAKYPKLANWRARFDKLPFAGENRQGLKEHGDMIKIKLAE